MSNRNRHSKQSPPHPPSPSQANQPARLEKLAQARKLLSLHQLEACRTLAQEVLREDPTDPVALGLMELSDPAMFGARPAASSGKKDSQATIHKKKKRHPESHPPRESIESGGPHQGESLIDPQFSFLLALAHTQEAGSRADSSPNGAETATGLETGTMRERTISAMVDILHNRKNTIRTWSDPRFPRDDGAPWGNKQRAPHSREMASSSSQPNLPTTGPPGILRRIWNRLLFWKKSA